MRIQMSRTSNGQTYEHGSDRTLFDALRVLLVAELDFGAYIKERTYVAVSDSNRNVLKIVTECHVFDCVDHTTFFVDENVDVFKYITNAIITGHFGTSRYGLFKVSKDRLGRIRDCIRGDKLYSRKQTLALILLHAFKIYVKEEKVLSAKLETLIDAISLFDGKEVDTQLFLEMFDENPNMDSGLGTTNHHYNMQLGQSV